MQKDKLVYWSFAGVLVLACLFFYFFPALFPPSKKVCFGQNCFASSVSATAKQRERGLMGVKSMPQAQAMIFIFDKEDFYPFWMKDTLIPLDIIWIGADKKVVFVKENAQPCQAMPCQAFVPQSKAKYVLEINAGLAEKFNIKTGSQADF